jgi:hypothetical protein
VPHTRPLKVFAFDPSLGRQYGNVMNVGVDHEELSPGPRGKLIEVIDYDVSNDCYYPPVDLDDRRVLLQGGLNPSENDPQFHQQMVYAVAMKILDVFDRALGRPIDLGTTPDGRPRPLRIFPHAFEGANAFFEPSLGAILFGYFRVSDADAGELVPGQIIYTCLSHDIVAHEFTHALVERLSPDLSKSENPDSIALHEGLADLVLLLNRFSIESVLREEIRRTRGTLGYDSPFVKIASQFAAALGRKHGLRNPMEKAKGNDYASMQEPHERGSLLMSAFFEALFETYRGRVEDLFQIAHLQWASEGDALHPDRVVSGGAITLASPATQAWVGLPYTSRLRALRLEGGAVVTAQGKTKRVSRLTIRVLSALGGLVGPPDESVMEPLVQSGLSDPMDASSPLRSGDFDVHLASDYDTGGQFTIVQSDPLPLDILCVMPQVTVIEG